VREEGLRAKIEELGRVLRNRESAVQTGVEAIAQSEEPVCEAPRLGASSLGCSLRIATTVAVSQELAALQKMQEMERTLERVEALAQDEVVSSS
jgi:hypothetical protein